MVGWNCTDGQKDQLIFADVNEALKTLWIARQCRYIQRNLHFQFCLQSCSVLMWSVAYFLSLFLHCLNSLWENRSKVFFSTASIPLRMWSPASMCTTQSGTWPLIRWNSFTSQSNIETPWGSPIKNSQQCCNWWNCIKLKGEKWGYHAIFLELRI